jgi:SulP family sulfate permease
MTRQRLRSSLVDFVRARARVDAIPIAAALRRTVAAGYDATSLRADVLAGIVVGVVALPLSMALGIAVGVPPQHGLYTAIVAGAVVALTGGSKFQVTGPTAAFVVILAPIVGKYGLQGLLTAGVMAGAILVVMGVARLGKLIQYIPHPVTTGFTAGIAVVIATLQIKDVLGLPVASMPEHYVDKVAAMWNARSGASTAEACVAVATLALLIVLPKTLPKIPAPLLAIGAVTIAATIVARLVPAFHVATIGSRFHTTLGGVTYDGIPPLPPRPMIPWGDMLSFAYLRELLPAAFAIAMLGAIESLLSAVIADGLTGKRHDPNAELVGLGLGNLIVPFFGGIAATGALARTATNVRAGARSPFAAVVHAAFVLMSIVLFARFVSYVPMASLAALLLVVAWNMSEVRHFLHVARVAPKSDVIVLLSCFFLTVAFDMVVAVGAGIVLAALLFMRRMAELTSARSVLDEGDDETTRSLPSTIALYEIAGPLFFGAAQNAMGAFETAGGDARVVVLDLGRVPVIDATGLVALESAIGRVRRAKQRVVIAGPLPEPRRIFERSELKSTCYLAPSRDDAIDLAVKLTERAETPEPPPSQPARSWTKQTENE